MAKPKPHKSKARQSNQPRKLRSTDLTRGYGLGRGLRLRLARADEVGRVGELLALTHVAIDEAALRLLAEGRLAKVALLGLDQGQEAMMRPIAEAAHAGDPGAGLEQMILVLVVTDAEGQIQAAFQSMPASGVFSKAVAMGADPIRCVWGASVVTKMQALAVDPDRQGQGIGSRLLAEALRIHRQLGAHLAYGQFDEGSGLERYYAARGLTIAPAGHGIDLGPVTDIRTAIGVPLSERLLGWWKYPAAMRFEPQDEIPIQIWETRQAKEKDDAARAAAGATEVKARPSLLRRLLGLAPKS